MISEYYVLLRSTLRAKPHLRRCLSRCRHCRIFTHPRNAGRRELGCPFGCKQEHRRRESIRRSTAYYQGEQGRDYKRRQNQRQRGQVDIVEGKAAAQSPPKAPMTPSAAELAEALPAAKDAEVVEHVRVVVSLIEGPLVNLEEIWGMLLGVVRQRSIPKRPPIDHALAWLHANPP